MTEINNPTLDDVMDWYGLERQEGVNFSIEKWQKLYPQYAEDLAIYEEFLRRVAIVDLIEGEQS